MSSVIIYEHSDRKGKKLAINLDNISLNQVYSLRKDGMDNAMSSVSWDIKKGYKLIIYEDGEGQGRQLGFTGSGIDNNIKLSRDFNDKASSYRFIKNNNVPEFFGVISPRPAVIKFNSKGSFHGTDGIIHGHNEHYQGVQVIDDKHIIISMSDFMGAYFFIIRWKKGILSGETGTVIKQIRINDDFKGMEFNHPGGMQVMGNVVAISLEYIGTPESKPGPESGIVFYDISDRENPKKTGIKIDREVKSACAVGMSKYEDRIILVAGGTDTQELDFYESGAGQKSITGKTVFKLIKTWKNSSVNKKGWLNDGWAEYQGLNLISDIDGAIYLIAVKQSAYVDMMAGYNSCIDLFSVDIKAPGTKSLLKKISKKLISCENSTSQEYGSGVHITGRRIHYIITGSGRSDNREDSSIMLLNYFS